MFLLNVFNMRLEFIKVRTNHLPENSVVVFDIEVKLFVNNVKSYSFLY